MPYSLDEHDDDDDEDEEEHRKPRLVFEKLLQIQLSDARERGVARMCHRAAAKATLPMFFSPADCSELKRDVLLSISVSTSMVHRPPRHAALLIRIITSPATAKANSTMARVAATPRIKQRRHPAPRRRRRQAVLEFIGANPSCINVTVTMISHRNVSRAIRPSDLNCKY